MTWAPRRPLVRLLLVAVAGALIGHELGYALGPFVGEAASTTPHDHLDQFLRIVPAAGVLTVVVAGLTDPRRARHVDDRISVGRLASLQGVLYGALEIGERLLHGQTLHGLAEPPVVLGGLAQLLVAVLLVSLARLTRRVLHLLDHALGAPVLGTQVFTAARRWRAVEVLRPGSLGSRAPPVVLSR